MTSTGPWRTQYHTYEEIAFLRELRERSSDGFARYAALVRCGMREYDATVNRGAVLLEIARLEAEA